MCGDKKAASIELSHGKIYGLGAFSEKFKDSDFTMNLDLCSEVWENSVNINL